MAVDAGGVAIPGRASGAHALEVEVVCSDVIEHQRRVESRVADINGHRLPTWQDVVERDYRPWDTPRLVIDTARVSVAEAARLITDALSNPLLVGH